MRLIDADAIPEVSADPYEEAGFRGTIEDMPTIDAIQVIRCRDCKWWGLLEYNSVNIHVCKRQGGVRIDDDYCSRAERREE